MISRLGRVVWWFGALLMAVGVILAVSAVPYLKKDARTEMLARQLNAVQTQIDRMNQTPTASPALPPNLQWLNHPLNSKLQTRAEELQNQISAIQSRRIAAEDKLLSGLLLLAFAVTCWAVSYVLGGRFWLPPSGAAN
jgi:uncharacterized membrane protein YciS (DUF1049 family)